MLCEHFNISKDLFFEVMEITSNELLTESVNYCLSLVISSTCRYVQVTLFSVMISFIVCICDLKLKLEFVVLKQTKIIISIT